MLGAREQILSKAQFIGTGTLSSKSTLIRRLKSLVMYVFVLGEHFDLHHVPKVGYYSPLTSPDRVKYVPRQVVKRLSQQQGGLIMNDCVSLLPKVR